MKKATSLQRSLSSEIEGEAIAKLDQFNPLPLSFGQGFETLNASSKYVSLGFFVPARNLFLRVLAGMQNPFMGNTASRSLAVRSTRYLTVSIRESNGAHNHA